MRCIQTSALTASAVGKGIVRAHLEHLKATGGSLPGYIGKPGTSLAPYPPRRRLELCHISREEAIRKHEAAPGPAMNDRDIP
ncbi:hypothetical protein [Streptomyces sp. 2A115]|uniref:hypothetical protein n=1 Tax=Streptomyces sp. 2A115 TaxID=3457439 RepID=UPI003FCFDC07